MAKWLDDIGSTDDKRLALQDGDQEVLFFTMELDDSPGGLLHNRGINIDGEWRYFFCPGKENGCPLCAHEHPTIRQSSIRAYLPCILQRNGEVRWINASIFVLRPLKQHWQEEGTILGIPWRYSRSDTVGQDRMGRERRQPRIFIEPLEAGAYNEPPYEEDDVQAVSEYVLKEGEVLDPDELRELVKRGMSREDMAGRSEDYMP